MQMEENKTLSLVIPENWHFLRGDIGVSSANYLIISFIEAVSNLSDLNYLLNYECKLSRILKLYTIIEQVLDYLLLSILFSCIDRDRTQE